MILLVALYRVCRDAVCVLPVVEQDVWCPDLVRGETEVFHSRMLALVPLEIVVEPALKHTDADKVCHSLLFCFTFV